MTDSPALWMPTDQANAPSPKAVARISAIAHREAGLHIAPGKAAMLRTRLARRLRALGLPDFDAYAALVSGPDGAHEVPAMISALTTNVSHFFRESHHFELLRKDVLPALLERAKSGGRVRIWSAGCSNGQEPFSIAMTLREAGLPETADVRILGTDIDPSVIEFARRGIYSDAMVSGVPASLRDQCFTPQRNTGETDWAVRDEIRDMVRFRILNLLDEWPMHGRFDAIFCRNVVIYFDAATQDRLWPRFANALQPGGWLFVGHSERVSEAAEAKFRKTGVTAYMRKPDVGGPGADAH